MQLATDNPNPKLGGKKRRGYDNGFRMGTFDRCNGKPPRDLTKIADTKYNRAYSNGYLDGYVTNESEV